MTNKEMAIELLNMIPGDDEQTQTLISAAMRLLKEPDPEAPSIKAPAKPEPKQESAAPVKKRGPRKKLDWGKAKACYAAGWDIAKIADELGCTSQAVRLHFQKEGLLK